MLDPQRQHQIGRWLTAVLFASIFVDPENAGLTPDELLELARREGYGRAEVFDHYLLRDCPTNEGRLLPGAIMLVDLVDFDEAREGDPRNIEAYQWVVDQFSELYKERGRAGARIPTSVLLERAALPRIDVYAAIVSYVLLHMLEEREGVLHCLTPITSPRMQLAARGGQRRPGTRGPHPAAAVMAQVRDVVARRADGRPTSSDPIRAFGAKFAELVDPALSIWWAQQVNELVTSNTETHPGMMLTAAASLVEGALTAIVKRARELTDGAAFGSSDFDKPGTGWKLEGLLRAARHPTAGIFTAATDTLYQDAMRLNHNRQRIHLARFLMETNPISVDVRPHDAENAVTTLKRVLTLLLEWLSERERAK